MKPPNKLSVTSTPERVYVGKDTTVQDFLDWINYFQAQNYVLRYENAYLRNALKPKPDNIVELPKPKRIRTRKPKIEESNNE